MRPSDLLFYTTMFLEAINNIKLQDQEPLIIKITPFHSEGKSMTHPKPALRLGLPVCNFVAANRQLLQGIWVFFVNSIPVSKSASMTTAAHPNPS
jgi:hypothetical protein